METAEVEELRESVALEYLAALSVLARWIDEAAVVKLTDESDS